MDSEAWYQLVPDESATVSQLTLSQDEATRSSSQYATTMLSEYSTLSQHTLSQAMSNLSQYGMASGREEREDNQAASQFTELSAAEEKSQDGGAEMTATQGLEEYSTLSQHPMSPQTTLSLPLYRLDPVGFQDSQDESGLADLSYAFSQRTVPGQEDQSRASAGPQTADEIGNAVTRNPNHEDLRTSNRDRANASAVQSAIAEVSSEFITGNFSLSQYPLPESDTSSQSGGSTERSLRDFDLRTGYYAGDGSESSGRSSASLSGDFKAGGSSGTASQSSTARSQRTDDLERSSTGQQLQRSSPDERSEVDLESSYTKQRIDADLDGSDLSNKDGNTDSLNIEELNQVEYVQFHNNKLSEIDKGYPGKQAIEQSLALSKEQNGRNEIDINSEDSILTRSKLHLEEQQDQVDTEKIDDDDAGGLPAKYFIQSPIEDDTGGRQRLNSEGSTASNDSFGYLTTATETYHLNSGGVGIERKSRSDSNLPTSLEDFESTKQGSLLTQRDKAVLKVSNSADPVDALLLEDETGKKMQPWDHENQKTYSVATGRLEEIPSRIPKTTLGPPGESGYNEGKAVQEAGVSKLTSYDSGRVSGISTDRSSFEAPPASSYINYPPDLRSVTPSSGRGPAGRASDLQGTDDVMTLLESQEATNGAVTRIDSNKSRDGAVSCLETKGRDKPDVLHDAGLDDYVSVDERARLLFGDLYKPTGEPSSLGGQSGEVQDEWKIKYDTTNVNEKSQFSVAREALTGGRNNRPPQTHSMNHNAPYDTMDNLFQGQNQITDDIFLNTEDNLGNLILSNSGGGASTVTDFADIYPNRNPFSLEDSVDERHKIYPDHDKSDIISNTSSKSNIAKSEEEYKTVVSDDFTVVTDLISDVTYNDYVGTDSAVTRTETNIGMSQFDDLVGTDGAVTRNETNVGMSEFDDSAGTDGAMARTGTDASPPVLPPREPAEGRVLADPDTVPASNGQKEHVLPSRDSFESTSTAYQDLPPSLTSSRLNGMLDEDGEVASMSSRAWSGMSSSSRSSSRSSSSSRTTTESVQREINTKSSTQDTSKSVTKEKDNSDVYGRGLEASGMERKSPVPFSSMHTVSQEDFMLQRRISSADSVGVPDGIQGVVRGKTGSSHSVRSSGPSPSTLEAHPLDVYVPERRISPTGSDESIDSFGMRARQVLRTSSSKDLTIGNSKAPTAQTDMTPPEESPGLATRSYSYNTLGDSISIPMGSGISNDTTNPTLFPASAGQSFNNQHEDASSQDQHQNPPRSVGQSPVVELNIAVDKQTAQLKKALSATSIVSTDSLGRRVQHLLRDTRHLSQSPTETSDVDDKVGISGRIDYRHLQMDLEEIEGNLAHTSGRIGEDALGSSRESPLSIHSSRSAGSLGRDALEGGAVEDVGSVGSPAQSARLEDTLGISRDSPLSVQSSHSAGSQSRGALDGGRDRDSPSLNLPTDRVELVDNVRTSHDSSAYSSASDSVKGVGTLRDMQTSRESLPSSNRSSQVGDDSPVPALEEVIGQSSAAASQGSRSSGRNTRGSGTRQVVWHDDIASDDDAQHFEEVETDFQAYQGMARTEPDGRSYFTRDQPTGQNIIRSDQPEEEDALEHLQAGAAEASFPSPNEMTSANISMASDPAALASNDSSDSLAVRVRRLLQGPERTADEIIEEADDAAKSFARSYIRYPSDLRSTTPGEINSVSFKRGSATPGETNSVGFKRKSATPGEMDSVSFQRGSHSWENESSLIHSTDIPMSPPHSKPESAAKTSAEKTLQAATQTVGMRKRDQLVSNPKPAKEYSKKTEKYLPSSSTPSTNGSTQRSGQPGQGAMAERPLFNEAGSLLLTPIATGPFTAFSKANAFLNTQMAKMSDSRFDQSVELRSPVKRILLQSRPQEGSTAVPTTTTGRESRDSHEISVDNSSPGVAGKSVDYRSYIRYPSDLRSASPREEEQNSRQTTTSGLQRTGERSNLSRSRDDFDINPRSRSSERLTEPSVSRPHTRETPLEGSVPRPFSDPGRMRSEGASHPRTSSSATGRSSGAEGPPRSSSQDTDAGGALDLRSSSQPTDRSLYAERTKTRTNRDPLTGTTGKSDQYIKTKDTERSSASAMPGLRYTKEPLGDDFGQQSEFIGRVSGAARTEPRSSLGPVGQRTGHMGRMSDSERSVPRSTQGPVGNDNEQKRTNYLGRVSVTERAVQRSAAQETGGRTAAVGRADQRPSLVGSSSLTGELGPRSVQEPNERTSSTGRSDQRYTMRSGSGTSQEPLERTSGAGGLSESTERRSVSGRPGERSAMDTMGSAPSEGTGPTRHLEVPGRSSVPQSILKQSDLRGQDNVGQDKRKSGYLSGNYTDSGPVYSQAKDLRSTARAEDRTGGSRVMRSLGRVHVDLEDERFTGETIDDRGVEDLGSTLRDGEVSDRGRVAAVGLDSVGLDGHRDYGGESTKQEKRQEDAGVLERGRERADRGRDISSLEQRDVCAPQGEKWEAGGTARERRAESLEERSTRTGRQLNGRDNRQGSSWQSAAPPRSAGTSPASSDDSQRGNRNTPPLRPYKRHGSSEVYYIESGHEDSTMSVGPSETTLESTHTGSDDAQPPYIPPHLLGSRKDPPSQADGIYGTKKSPKHQSPQTPALGTIKEDKPLDEDRESPLAYKEGTKPADAVLASKRPPIDSVLSTQTAERREERSRLVLEEEKNKIAQRSRSLEALPSGHEDLFGHQNSLEQERRHILSETRLDLERRSRSPDVRLERGAARSTSPERSRPSSNPRSRSPESDRGKRSVAVVGSRARSPIRAWEDNTETPGSRFERIRDRAQEILYNYERQYPPKESPPKPEFSTPRRLGAGSRGGSREEEEVEEEKRAESRDDVDDPHHRTARSYIHYPADLRSKTPREGRNEERGVFTPLLPDQNGDSPAKVSVDMRDAQIRMVSPEDQHHQYPAVKMALHRERPDARSASPERAYKAVDFRDRYKEEVDLRPMPDLDGPSDFDGWSNSSYGAPPGGWDTELDRDERVQRLRGVLERDEDYSNLPPNLNAIWEKFQALNHSPMDSMSDTSQTNIDLERFANLLKNPVKHLSLSTQRPLSGEVGTAPVRNRPDTSRHPSSPNKGKDKENYDMAKRYVEKSRLEKSQTGQQHQMREYEENDSETMMKSSFEISKPKRHVQTKKVRHSTTKEQMRSGDIGESVGRVQFDGQLTSTDDSMSTLAPGESTTVSSDASTSVVPTVSELLTSDQQDSTLLTIPEDTTLGSLTSDLSISSSDHAKVQYRGKDPELQKLQQMIHKQRMKYEKEEKRKIRRREKIEKLEKILLEKNTRPEGRSERTEKSSGSGAFSRVEPSRKVKKSQSQSSQTSDTVSLGTVVEESSVLTDTDVNPPLSQSQSEEDTSRTGQDTDQSVCACKQATRGKAVSEKRKSKSQDSSHRNKHKHSKEQPVKQVIGPRSAYIEFKKPHHQSPKKVKLNKKKNATSGKSNSNTRDFGQTCPTPVQDDSLVQRKDRKVTMVSEGVQTTPRLLSSSQPHSEPAFIQSQQENRRQPSLLHRASVKSPRKDESIFKTRSKDPTKKMPAQASPSGIAWYVPVPDTKPWRQPLKESQASNSRAVPGTSRGAPEPLKKLTLKEAFELHKASCASQINERQKRIHLASEQRHLDEGYAAERAMLFADKRRKMANPEAHPYSEHLHQPKRRTMTREEMKEITQKIYRNLPEVKQRIVDKKREDEYKTNRIRAQMYKQKVLTTVLRKRGAGPWGKK